MKAGKMHWPCVILLCIDFVRFWFEFCWPNVLVRNLPSTDAVVSSSVCFFLLLGKKWESANLLYSLPSPLSLGYSQTYLSSPLSKPLFLYYFILNKKLHITCLFHSFLSWSNTSVSQSTNIWELHIFTFLIHVKSKIILFPLTAFLFFWLLAWIKIKMP